MLTIPNSMLVIGVFYRDPYYCPIEPRISRFLIGGGSVSIVYTHSIIAVICVVILSVITIVGQISSIIWLIVGSVWTSSIRNRVEFIINYPFNIKLYCHWTSYQFTFAYLIIIYILLHYQFFVDILQVCVVQNNKNRFYILSS
jgi:hypothetical protein